MTTKSSILSKLNDYWEIFRQDMYSLVKGSDVKEMMFWELDIKRAFERTVQPILENQDLVLQSADEKENLNLIKVAKGYEDRIETLRHDFKNALDVIEAKDFRIAELEKDVEAWKNGSLMRDREIQEYRLKLSKVREIVSEPLKEDEYDQITQMNDQLKKIREVLK